LSYVAKSKILEEVIVELKKQKIDIPLGVLSDLKAARTLIQVEKATPQSRNETEPKIDQYLNNVEAYVMSEADKILSPQKVDTWISQLNVTTCSPCFASTGEAKEPDRFVTGVPRNQKWVRIQPLTGWPTEKIVQTATQAGLGAKVEPNQNVTVYGTPEAIKELIKKMAAQTPKKSQ
jgi:hypothetical protein